MLLRSCEYFAGIPAKSPKQFNHICASLEIVIVNSQRHCQPFQPDVAEILGSSMSEIHAPINRSASSSTSLSSIFSSSSLSLSPLNSSPCLNPRFLPLRCSLVSRDTALYAEVTVRGRSGEKVWIGMKESKIADHGANITCRCNRCCTCHRHRAYQRQREVIQQRKEQSKQTNGDEEEKEEEEGKREADLGSPRKRPKLQHTTVSSSSSSVSSSVATSSSSSTTTSVSSGHFLSHPPCTDRSVVSTNSDLSGRFILGHRLGSGTFSSVFLARVRHEHELNRGLPDEVAIKRFLIQSHPRRLETEEEFLYRYGDVNHHILPLLSSHHVLGAPPALVLPYCKHQEFRDHYRSMSLRMIQTYLRGLLTALAHLASFLVIHRDVKPENYLFDFEAAREYEKSLTQATSTSSPPSPSSSSSSSPSSSPSSDLPPEPRLGFLVDFGLAHTEIQLKNELKKDHRSSHSAHIDGEANQADDDAHTHIRDIDGDIELAEQVSLGLQPSPSALTPIDPTTPQSFTSIQSNGEPSPTAKLKPSLTPRKSPRQSRPTSKVVAFRSDLQSSRPPRPSAPRAGTRGFRAPETLASSCQQSVAVDCWSTGILLLSIMCHRYPFFACNDDETGLAEILYALHPSRGHTEIVIAGQRVTYENNHGPEFNLREYCTVTSGVVWPEELFELLDGLLQIDPSQRWTAQQALESKFFQRDYTKQSIQRISREEREKRRKAQSAKGQTIQPSSFSTLSSPNPTKRPVE